MKFGEELKRVKSANPDWAAFFLDYDTLKSFISIIKSLNKTLRDEPDLETPQRMSASIKANFVEMLHIVGRAFCPPLSPFAD